MAVVNGLGATQSTPGNGSSQASQDTSAVQAGSYCRVCSRGEYVTLKCTQVKNEAELRRIRTEQFSALYLNLVRSGHR